MQIRMLNLTWMQSSVIIQTYSKPRATLSVGGRKLTSGKDTTSDMMMVTEKTISVIKQDIVSK